MAITLENFEYIKSSGEELYKSFEPVKCPYFNELVHFNAAGLEHLKFKRRGVERVPQDQYMRFKLLYLAPQIIKLSRTLQGVYRINGFEPIRQQSKTQFVLRPTTYYELISVMEEVRVKVILKQIENGQLIFWSIIPFWGVTHKQGRQLYSGNPAED